MPRSIFIVGCYRSGTTLLRKILNLSSGIYIAKETGFIPEVVHTGNPIITQALVDQVNSYLRIEKWFKLASCAGFSLFLGESGKVTWRDFVQYIWQLELSTKEYAELLYIGDNSPKYIMTIPLLEEIFQDSVYIHIVRDPRDVVASVLPLAFGGHTALVAAREWLDRVGSWALYQQILPADRKYQLRYEDLVCNPDEEIAKLFRFLNVPLLASQLKHTQLPKDEVSELPHHAKLRMKINSDSVGAYRQKLSQKQIEIIESIAYTGLKAYGYEVNAYRPSILMQEKNTTITICYIQDLFMKLCNRIL